MILEGQRPKLIIIEGIDRVGKTFNLLKNLQSDKVFNPDAWLKATDPWHNYCFAEDNTISRSLNEQEDFRYLNPHLHMWTLPSILYNVLHQSPSFMAIVKDRWALSPIFYNRFRLALNATYGVSHSTKQTSAYNSQISFGLERLLATIFDVHQYVFCMSLEDANEYYDNVKDNVWSSHQLKQLNQMFLEDTYKSTTLPTTLIELTFDRETMRTNIQDYLLKIKIEQGL